MSNHYITKCKYCHLTIFWVSWKSDCLMRNWTVLTGFSPLCSFSYHELNIYYTHIWTRNLQIDLWVVSALVNNSYHETVVFTNYVILVWLILRLGKFYQKLTVRLKFLEIYFEWMGSSRVCNGDPRVLNEFSFLNSRFKNRTL